MEMKLEASGQTGNDNSEVKAFDEARSDTAASGLITEYLGNQGEAFQQR